MENAHKRLTLNQETLRNLTRADQRDMGGPGGTHTCANGACPSHNPPHCIAVAERSN